MKQSFSNFCRAWRGIRAFSKLSSGERAIVFYAENGGAWPHLGPIIRALVSDHGLSVIYLTSAPNDPVLSGPADGVTPYFVGEGHLRTWLFRSIEADILVMTMPDLDTFHIKRSMYPVHYVYTHHSIVSTHMIYREAAFDNFDTVFCVGPHHEQEIRATEALCGLHEKKLVQHGYPRLDSIQEEIAEETVAQHDRGDRILVAPSWGPEGLLERHGVELTSHLLDASFHVTIRPHPMTRRLAGPSLDRLKSAFSGRPNFSYEEDVASTESLRSSSLMVSDWSGAALEFAFSRQRPVLFVDVPRKVNNPNWKQVGITPLEDSIREEIGTVLPLDRLADAAGFASDLLMRKDEFALRIQEARRRHVFNLGNSAKVAADYIASVASTKE